MPISFTIHVKKNKKNIKKKMRRDVKKMVECTPLFIQIFLLKKIILNITQLCYIIYLKN